MRSSSSAIGRPAALLAVLLATLLCSPVLATAGEGRYLVDTGERLPADFERSIAAAGGTVERLHPEIGVAVVRLERDLAAALKSGGELGRLVPDVQVDLGDHFKQMVMQRVSVPGGRVAAPAGLTPDPTSAFFYSCQWNKHLTDAETAWALGVFGNGIKVAVIGSGIDPDHQDLIGHVDDGQGASFLAPGSSPCGAPDEDSTLDFHLFSTAVASMIATNGIGIAGIAPEAQMVPIKATNCALQSTVADFIAGTYYAADLRDVDVIMFATIGFYLEDNADTRTLVRMWEKAVRRALRRGKLVIANAGDQATDLSNDPGFIALPAELRRAFTIYAVGNDPAETLTANTNRGFPETEFGAPSGIFPNTQPQIPGCALPPNTQGGVLAVCSSDQVTFPPGCDDTQYLAGVGSAFAAAEVAGAAALVDGKYWGLLPPFLVRAILVVTSDDPGAPGTDPVYGFGRLNAGRAVSVLPKNLEQ